MIAVVKGLQMADWLMLVRYVEIKAS